MTYLDAVVLEYPLFLPQHVLPDPVVFPLWVVSREGYRCVLVELVESWSEEFEMGCDPLQRRWNCGVEPKVPLPDQQRLAEFKYGAEGL